MKENKLLEKKIKEIVKPIFDKAVPKEKISDSMTTTPKKFSIFWRPNNYRRQIKVKTKTNSTLNEIRGAIPKLPVESKFNYNEHTKLISIKNYIPNITLQYGKHTLTAIYSQNIIRGHKEVFFIESDSIEGLQERINQKKEEIEKTIDFALFDFIKQFKISLPFKKPKWDRYEDFVKGEEFIDKIPREVIIHDTFFKKVYGQGIEFKQTEKKEEPIIHFKNYIKNRLTEDYAPEIADSIDNLGNALLNELNPSIKELDRQIRTHLKVQKDTLKTNKEMRSTLKDISSSLVGRSLRKKREYKIKDVLSQTNLNKWL